MKARGAQDDPYLTFGGTIRRKLRLPGRRPRRCAVDQRIISSGRAAQPRHSEEPTNGQSCSSPTFSVSAVHSPIWLLNSPVGGTAGRAASPWPVGGRSRRPAPSGSLVRRQPVLGRYRTPPQCRAEVARDVPSPGDRGILGTRRTRSEPPAITSRAPREATWRPPR